MLRYLWAKETVTLNHRTGSSCCFPLPGWSISEILVYSLRVISQWQTTSLSYKKRRPCQRRCSQSLYHPLVHHIHYLTVPGNLPSSCWCAYIRVKRRHIIKVCFTRSVINQSINRLRVECEDALVVATNQENRREVLGQGVQPGHVQSTGHCSFSGQGHTPIREREKRVCIWYQSNNTSSQKWHHENLKQLELCNAFFLFMCNYFSLFNFTQLTLTWH